MLARCLSARSLAELLMNMNCVPQIKVALVLLVALACVCLLSARHATADANNASATDRYNQEISKNYDFKFGPDPFAPSNATTTTGKFIPGDMFISATRCQKCHTDAHSEWLQSAHRNAFREPFYPKNVKDLISQRGIEYTRHCESCHNPAALFSGALTKDAHVKRPFD